MSFSQGLAKIKENEESRAKSTPIAMVAPELKQNTDADTEITKTCAVLGCEESKKLSSDLFFRFPEDENLRQIWTDLTGRNNWMPTDYSYICVQHFSADSFEGKSGNKITLESEAIPSLKLPKHVLEVEYIDEETLDNETAGNENLDHEYEEEDYLMDSDEYIDDEILKHEVSNEISHEVAKHASNLKQEKQTKQQLKHEVSHENSYEFAKQVPNLQHEKQTKKHEVSHNEISHEVAKQVQNNLQQEKQTKVNRETKLLQNHSQQKSEYLQTIKPDDSLELLKLFTDVQRMQRQSIALKEKLKSRNKIFKRQEKFLSRIKEVIEMKRNILNQRKKKKSRILLSLQDKIKEDTSGLVLAMPTRHSDDLKNFALSIYKYSPQAYIYIRNALRTLLPSTDVLESWVSAGFEPKNVMSNSNMIKVISELTDSELSCKVSLR